MAWIIETPNAFEPFRLTKEYVSTPMRIRDWVVNRHPERLEFPVPTICLLNGKPLLREEWGREVGAKDVVNFVAVPQGYVAIIIIAVVVAIAVALFMPLPPVPGEGPQSDPVYSNKGQVNAIRLGEPIEVCYGTNRIFPSLASRPFYQYRDNDQYQFSLFCLGHGYFDIHAVQIGDTPIENYDEAEYEVIPPGSQPTLFPTNVATAVEVGGQTIFASNEEDYSGEGWLGPFPACPTGTKTTLIEIDLVFPKGLYRMSSTGGLNTKSIQVEGQVRAIDDAGDPIGDWQTLTVPSPITVSGTTTTPQRRTFMGEVDLGRYEVRMRRLDMKDLSHKAGHEVAWEGLRAFIEEEEEEDFGEVTLLAVRIRATNNLNDRTAQRFNVIATRKLPTRIDGEWTEPVATRSIVWALVDLFRGFYGGRIDSDVYFDWEALMELETIYTERGDTFDWVFRDNTTVWDAARTIGRAGRATPLLSGSLITMRRDGPLEIPVAMFNQENIVQGTFSWDVRLWDVDEHDSIQVEYTEPSTGYKQEQVTAVLPGNSAYNPKSVRLQGVQNRTQAYREGMYLLATQFYLRENITFETGLEGHLPSYGDLIAVAHDVPKWGQSGVVVDAEAGGGDQYLLRVSEPLEFTPGETHQIFLRGSQGQVLGPLTCYQTQDPQQVIIQAGEVIDFQLTGLTEPMLFLFGVAHHVTRYLKVVKIEPQGGERIRITAVNEAAEVHSFDGLVPTPLKQTPYAPIPPDLPTIAQLYITQIDDALLIVQVAWTAAFGAQRYVVQMSTDGDNWENAAETTRTSVQLQVQLGPLWVRVAAINNGQGPWVESSVTIGPLLGLDVLTEWETLEWKVGWSAVLNALGYQVRVYDNTDSENPVLKRVTDLAPGSLSFEYDFDMAETDGNVNRAHLVTVDAMLEEATPLGSPVSSSFSIPLPGWAPVGLSHTFLSEDEDKVTYRLHWSQPIVPVLPGRDILHRVKVWVAPDFHDLLPENINLLAPVFDETVDPIGVGNLPTEFNYEALLDSNGSHPGFYWRVSVFDIWGEEIGNGNLSSVAAVPASISQ